MNKTNNIVIIIKNLLSIHKLTQVDFAIKTGIPLATVKKYLQGAFNPTVKNINKIELCFDFYISKILKIDLDNIDELEKIEYKYRMELKEKREIRMIEEDKIKKDFITDPYNPYFTTEEKAQSILNNDFGISLIKEEIEKIENTLDFINILKMENIYNRATKIKKLENLEFNNFETAFIDFFLKIGIDTKISKDKKIKLKNLSQEIDIKEFSFLISILKENLENEIKKYDKFLEYRNNEKNSEKDSD